MSCRRSLLTAVSLLLLCISLCLAACTDAENPPLTANGYREESANPTAAVTAVPTDTENTAKDTADVTTGDTQQISFDRYTLRHTVSDFSAHLPSYIPQTLSDSPRNFYADERGLHLYVNDRETASANIYTFSPTSDEVSVVPVPKIEKSFPYYAYLLPSGRFVMIAKKNYQFHLFLTEGDGTVIAEQRFYNSGSSPDGWVISEEENGDVTVLIGSGHHLDLYCYDADSTSLTMERHFDQSTRGEILRFSIQYAQHFGDRMYYSAVTRSSVKLDMKNGTLNANRLRVPETDSNIRYHVGIDHNIYLSNLDGVYLYSDDIPTKILDWTACNIRSTTESVWIIDSHTVFFFSMTDANGQSVYSLKRVTTERVPDVDLRRVIHITGFDATVSEWLTNAIFSFNSQSTEYRVDLRLISNIDRSHDDINAEIADIMLYQEHPDILMMTPTRWRPLDLYYEKDVFIDLLPYFGGDLLTCAAEGMTYNGALYTLPTTMYLQTFVCADTVTDSRLTWERFFEIIDSVSVPDSVLTTEGDVIDYIYNNGIMDFCDTEAGQSYYDTDAFRKMLTYHKRLGDIIDADAGCIESDVIGGFGYTRAALPAYLKEGKIKLLNVPVRKINDILTPMLLYGDTDFTWCGYPSSDGGGVYLSEWENMLSVFADSEVKEGCIEFLAYLLSVEQQSNPMLPHLPVTESGIRALSADNRYWYYSKTLYEKYSNPNAELEPSPFYGVLSGLKYIPTRAHGSTAQPTDTYGQQDDGIGDDEDRAVPTAVTYVTVEMTDAYVDAFIEFLNSCRMKANVDNKLRTIVTEEISYWENNARSLEETTKIINSRVWLYLNE